MEFWWCMNALSSQPVSAQTCSTCSILLTRKLIGWKPGPATLYSGLAWWGTSPGSDGSAWTGTRWLSQTLRPHQPSQLTQSTLSSSSWPGTLPNITCSPPNLRARPAVFLSSHIIPITPSPAASSMPPPSPTADVAPPIYPGPRIIPTPPKALEPPWGYPLPIDHRGQGNLTPCLTLFDIEI